jgi:hypothetical protein
VEVERGSPVLGGGGEERRQDLASEDLVAETAGEEDWRGQEAEWLYWECSHRDLWG